MSLMGVGLLVISLLRWFEGYAVVALGGALFGIGIAVAMPPASTVVINALPPAKAGDGSDVNLISRQVGGSFGVAVIGSVFAAIYAAHISAALTGASLEAARAAEHSFADTVALAESLPAPEREALLSRADRAFETAAQIALLVGAALAVLGAALASWLLRTTVVRAPAVAKPGMESAP
jgi:MFS family permease